MEITISQATSEDAAAVSRLVKALLEEIIAHTGAAHFTINLEQMTERCRQFLEEELTVVFKALVADQLVGVIALSEAHALYTEGAFGIITELYVVPEFRSRGAGDQLVDRAKQYGRARGWTRFEVTTPPLPEFERTIRFYEAQGFEVTGGRKLKISL